MEHTPGPWELDSAKDADGRYFIINGQIPKGINQDFGYPVADTLNRHHCISPEEDEGNARLIAAAPEMLNAVQVAWEWFDGRGDGAPDASPLQKQSLNMAENLAKVIKKATGNQPHP